MQLPAYLGIVRDAETHLADALTLLGDRHSADADVRDTARLLARWSRQHVVELSRFVDRYGVRDVGDPARLRAGLFLGARAGGLGALRDVHDLLAFATYVRGAWTAVFQAAMELHDADLSALGTAAAEDTDRQIAWMKTRLRTVAPQALTVPPSRMAALRASLPKTVTPAALPELAWNPLAAALLVGVVGVLGAIAGQPWLLPSLGPTAYLLAEQPAQPATRVYNIVAGHLSGLAAGIAGVLLAGAGADPIVLQAGTLTGARAGAAVIAIALTVFLGLALRASHPPAGATALLVALGSLSTTADVWHLGIGAAIVAVTGVLLRALRLGHWPRRAHTHEPGYAGPPAITQPVAPELKKAA